MFSVILSALVVAVNATPRDDTLLQQHPQGIDSEGFRNLAMDTLRNERDSRNGKFVGINETQILPT